MPDFTPAFPGAGGDQPGSHPNRGVDLELELCRSLLLEAQQWGSNLQAERDFLRRLIDTDPNAIFISDHGGRLVLVNRAFSTLLGISAQDLLRREVNNLPLPLEMQQFLSVEFSSPDLEPQIHSTVEVSGDFLGSLLWFQVTCLPVLDADGAISHRLVLMADISDRKLAEQALHESLQKTEQSLRRLSVLRNIYLALTSSGEFNTIVATVLQHVVELAEVDAANLLMPHPRRPTLEVKAKTGLEDQRNDVNSVPISDPYAGKAFRERQAVYIHDLARLPRSAWPNRCFQTRLKSYAALPLVTKDNVKGILEVFSQAQSRFDPEWKEFLHSLSMQIVMALENVELFSAMEKANDELSEAYDATIQGWSLALELRDKETKGHSERVTSMTQKLTQALDVPLDQWEHWRRGVLLHDIGKMGIPDRILLKPGPLSEDEWLVMRQHPQFAYQLLHKIPYLQPALDIPYLHHEKWNGGGYPLGLKGDQIPLPARLFAIVDVWDALTHERPYRPPWPSEKATNFIRVQSGIQFDPYIVNAFFSVLDQFSCGSALDN